MSLSQSHGVAKNGKEFPVEVRVSSFMVDREVYYVGVITELAQRCKALDMTASAGSDVFKHKVLHTHAYTHMHMRIHTHTCIHTHAHTHAYMSHASTDS